MRERRLIDTREDQRPRESDHRDGDEHADRRAGLGLGAREPEDRTEEHVHSSGAAARATVRRGVDGEEEGAEPEHPREHDSDHRVIGLASGAERCHHERDDNAGAVEPDS